MTHNALQRCCELCFLVFVLSGVAAAQSIIQIDFGIRMGLASNSFQANQLCSGAGCFFGTRSFTAERFPGTIGPAASVMLYDRVEVRFEAMRRRFGYQIRRDLVIPSTIEQHSVSSTRGHFWEYPLLATHRFSSGPLRPFAGGGLSLGTSGSYTTELQSTSTTQPPGGPVTTTSFDRRTLNLTSRTAYYVVGGLDGRTSYVSIRPEFRYTRFPNDSNSGAETIFQPNQFEFLIGISVHPFRIKKTKS